MARTGPSAVSTVGGDVNWEYIHLISHAFPIVLSVVGAGVGLVGWIIGRESLERYGLVSLMIAAVMAIPSYISGITAADVMVDRTFVRPGIVQNHRTWATWASIVLVTSGIFAVFSMTQPKDGRLRRFVLLLGLVHAALVLPGAPGILLDAKAIQRSPELVGDALEIVALLAGFAQRLRAAEIAGAVTLRLGEDGAGAMIALGLDDEDLAGMVA